MTETNESKILYHSPTIRSWKDEGHFHIPEVTYRGQTGTYRLFEQMTSALNQEQLAEFYEMEKQKGNPVPTDAPLIWAIAESAYNIKNNSPQEAEKLRQFLRQGMRKYPNTLTRVAYIPEGNDKILHNYRTSDEYSIENEVVGPDGWMTDIPDKNVLEFLIGTRDVPQINNVSQWINETNAYLWRRNSKPKERVERVARFDGDGNRLGLLCDRNPLVVYPAFLVLKVE